MKSIMTHVGKGLLFKGKLPGQIESSASVGFQGSVHKLIAFPDVQPN